MLFATTETNVCSSLAEPPAVRIADAAAWEAVQPKALKNHGKILLKIKAGEAAKLPPKAHPFPRRRNRQAAHGSRFKVKFVRPPKGK